MTSAALPRSIRLQCSLAAAITDPSSLIARDLLGVAPWGPVRLDTLCRGPHGHFIAHSLAIDLGLNDLVAAESLAVGLRTREDVRLALQISIAPAAEIRDGARQLAAAAFRKTIGGAVRKADRLMLSEYLGEDALLTATRQAETFWPSLSVFDTRDPALLGRPQDATEGDDASRQPEAVDAAWSRPRLAREIAGLPLLLRQSWGILHACVDATDKTSGAILRARFGAAITDLLPEGAALGRPVAERPLPPSQCAVIFNLLQRKVPAWSTSID